MEGCVVASSESKKTGIQKGARTVAWRAWWQRCGAPFGSPVFLLPGTLSRAGPFKIVGRRARSLDAAPRGVWAAAPDPNLVLGVARFGKVHIISLPSNPRVLQSKRGPRMSKAVICVLEHAVIGVGQGLGVRVQAVKHLLNTCETHPRSVFWCWVSLSVCCGCWLVFGPGCRVLGPGCGFWPKCVAGEKTGIQKGARNVAWRPWRRWCGPPFGSPFFCCIISSAVLDRI